MICANLYLCESIYSSEAIQKLYTLRILADYQIFRDSKKVKNEYFNF